jgi:hypothetical protein
LTAQAATAAFQPPSGTPVDGQKLWIQIIDNATPRALTFSSATGGYDQESIAMPTTTETSTYLQLGFVYLTANSFNKWQLVASTQGTRGATGLTGVTGPTGLTGVTGPTGPTSVVRYVSASVTASVTPNADTTDVFEIVPATGTYTFQLPSGTPTAGQTMKIILTSTGSGPHTIAWATTGYRPTGAPQILAVSTSKIYTTEFIYVTSNSLNKWVLYNNNGATGV